MYSYSIKEKSKKSVSSLVRKSLTDFLYQIEWLRFSSPKILNNKKQNDKSDTVI